MTTANAAPFTNESLQQWCARHNQPYVEYLGARALRLLVNNLPVDDTDKQLVYDVNSPTMFVGRMVQGCMLPPAGAVCTQDSHLVYEALTSNDTDPKTMLGRYYDSTDSSGRVLLRLPDNVPSVADECVFIGGIANFGHFIFESLLRLMALRWRPELSELPVAVYDHVPARFREFIAAVGIPAKRHILIKSDTPTRFECAWLLSAPMYRRAYDDAAICPDAAWWLRLATAHLARPIAGIRPRLFIARGTADWRRMANEAAVQKIAADYDISSCDLAKLSAAEQIGMVSNAELLICPGGAGSQISAFAPPDCVIIELVPPDFAIIFGPMAFAIALHQPYARITGRTAAPEEVAAAGLAPSSSAKLIDRDYVIDTGELDKTLAAALAKIELNRRA